MFSEVSGVPEVTDPLLQEDAAAGSAAEGQSCGSTGLLQPGEHLHSAPGL